MYLSIGFWGVDLFRLCEKWSSRSDAKMADREIGVSFSLPELFSSVFWVGWVVTSKREFGLFCGRHTSRGSSRVMGVATGGVLGP